MALENLEKSSQNFSEWLNFEPKQLEAARVADKHTYTLFGGAGGGGKSYWLRKYIIYRLIHFYSKTQIKGIVAGLFCESYPALKDRHVSKVIMEFPEWLGTYHSDHKFYGNCFILNPEWGAGVLAFRNLDDPSKYNSSEFAIIGVDELTFNKVETFDALRFRMRWPGLEQHGLRPQFVAGSNPGNIGHAWVKAYWLEGIFPDELKELASEFAFVPAKVTDNQYIGSDYLKTLDSLPETMRKAVRDGNWDVFEGAYFTEWNHAKHVIEPFKIPDHWKRYRAYDHGRDAPCSMGWYAIDNDGRVYCYREFHQAGLNVDQIAAEIVRLSGDETYAFSVADPSIFSNIGFTDRYGGQTIAETFSRYGVGFIPASNRRIDGWNLMHQYLHWDENKVPRLQFFSTCVSSIKSIPSLIHDTHRPEDLNSGGDDHDADQVRYGLMMLHEARSSPVKTDPNEPTIPEWWKLAMRAKKQSIIPEFYD